MSLLDLNNKIFGAKILRKTMFTLLSVFLIATNLGNIKSYKTEDFLLEPELNKELNRRMNYYNSIINDLKLMDSISIEVKSNKLYLKANQDFAAMDNIFVIPKFLFFTSCDMFPFKEYFLEALNHINKNSKIDLNKFSSNLILAYNMMYYKYADKEKAKKYYQELLKDKSDIVKEIDSLLTFDVHPEKKLYLDNIPSKNTRSLFFFNEEELQLAKVLGLEMITKVVFENTHKQIIQFLKKNLSEHTSVSYIIHFLSIKLNHFIHSNDLLIYCFFIIQLFLF